MKILIITVAGTATRFNRDLSSPTLKCLYYQENIKNSLLYLLCKRSESFDKIILVGGYLFSYLEKIIRKEFSAFLDQIELVENPHYADKGSMYSLYLGIQHSREYDCSEIAFVEGDLYVSEGFYSEFCNTAEDIITINREPIVSNKAVVLYVDAENKVHYVYDTAHQLLTIPVAVRAIFNSAQMWKMVDCERLFSLNAALTEEGLAGTNLVLIQKYFGDILWDNMCCMTVEPWFNCNTVDDYNKVFITMQRSIE